MMKVTSRVGLVLIALFVIAAYSESQNQTPVKLLSEDQKAGLELWQTAMGRLWIPRPGLDVIRHLQWEQTVQLIYDHPLVHVRQGDVVIDCGAHIGAFTRTALRAGAQTVVAIEPDHANLLAFKRNFQDEIRTGKVRLIEKGVWDSTGKLSLHTSTISDSHSAVIPQNTGKEESIDVTTLDALVQGMHLGRVDFIKMDIEGAEQKALHGSEQVLRKYHPRLAISSYHVKGDPAAICSIVWQTCTDYLVVSKDTFRPPDGVGVPKVLFFYH